MKFKNLGIENFLTIGNLVTLNLEDKGLMLIQGENRDDTSASSNGAGKSTIGDAVCYCLYGVTARGETGDGVINNIAGKGCRVEMSIESDGVMYVISRHRKHKKFKNSLVVENLTTSTTLTKGTDKLSQEVVNKIIGCSYEVFKSAIYAAQDSIPDLPQMTDKFLKAIVEEAAGIDRLSEAHDLAKVKLKDSLTLHGRAESSFDIIVRELEVELVTLDSLIKGRDEFDSVKRERIRQLEKGAKRAEDSRLIATAGSESVIKATIKSKISELDETLTKKLNKRGRLEADVSAANSLVAIAKNDYNFALSFIKSKIADLKDIEDTVGKPCGECGKTYRKEDLTDAANIARKNISADKIGLNETKVTHGELVEASKKAAIALKAFGDISSLVKETKAAVSSLQSELQKGIDFDSDVASFSEALRKVESDIAEAEGTEFSQHALIDRKKDRLKELNDEKLELVKLIKARFDESTLLKEAVDVFSPAGVRAHILDTVTPYLNERTSYYISTLSDGNISAVWNTLSKTKSGELREKFTIEVSNDKGSSTFAGLSGGEKRKVRLAAAMALQDLVSSRASKPINLWIADEIDDALDDAGLERLMILLEEKAREKGTVLMISHNSLGDWCRNQTLVTKEHGVVTVSGGLVESV